MNDRTIKSKSPWMKNFVIAKTEPLDEATKARLDALRQLKDAWSKGYGTNRRTVK